jgi:hypothetical protein
MDRSQDNRLLETMNRYLVRCNACQHYYQSVVVGGLRKLLHAKVELDQLNNPSLPTKQCRLMYDFVRFDPCNHCCPEVFELCPESHSGAVGKPTSDNCSA